MALFTGGESTVLANPPLLHIGRSNTLQQKTPLKSVLIVVISLRYKNSRALFSKLALVTTPNRRRELLSASTGKRSSGEALNTAQACG
jgi:hypothetical protein